MAIAKLLAICCLSVPTLLAAAELQAWTTTAMGAGADATIQKEQGNMGESKTVAVRNNQFPAHHMKGYLRFDLRKLERAPGAKLSGNLVAHLVLQLEGKADADHKINIFGLVERRSYGGSKADPILGADWSEKELTYANAPARSPYGGGVFGDGDKKWEKGMLGGVDHEHVSLLGTIELKKDQDGEVDTSMPDFTDFVEKNVKSKVVTLILCRITETVNGTNFRSKEWAAGQAPKLAFAAP